MTWENQRIGKRVTWFKIATNQTILDGQCSSNSYWRANRGLQRITRWSSRLPCWVFIQEKSWGSLPESCSILIKD